MRPNHRRNEWEFGGVMQPSMKLRDREESLRCSLRSRLPMNCLPDFFVRLPDVDFVASLAVAFGLADLLAEILAKCSSTLAAS